MLELGKALAQLSPMLWREPRATYHLRYSLQLHQCLNTQPSLCTVSAKWLLPWELPMVEVQNSMSFALLQPTSATSIAHFCDKGAMYLNCLYVLLLLPLSNASKALHAG